MSDLGLYVVLVLVWGIGVRCGWVLHRGAVSGGDEGNTP